MKLPRHLNAPMDLNARVVHLTPDEVAAAEQQPNTLVGRYEKVELAEHEQLHARTAGEVAEAVFARYQELRAEKPDASDDDVRDWIRGEDPAWKQFAARTHPTIFSILTNRGTSDDRVQTVRRIIDLASDVDDNKITKEEAGTKFMQIAMRPSE